MVNFPTIFLVASAALVSAAPLQVAVGVEVRASDVDLERRLNGNILSDGKTILQGKVELAALGAKYHTLKAVHKAKKAVKKAVPGGSSPPKEKPSAPESRELDELE